MMSDEIVAAIDVGTTKVCTIVGRRFGKRGIQVLGYSTVKSTGLRKGNVADSAATERAVRASIKAIQEKTGYRVDSAFVGITGAHVSFENRHAKLRTRNSRGIVTSDDIQRAPKKLSESVDAPGRRVIHANTISYALDGETGIRNPLGMHTKEMDVETHFVTGSEKFIDRLVGAVEAAGVKVESLVLEPLASGLSVLTPEERESGAVIVDIGGGTTDIVGFKGSRVYYTGVIPVGGYQFTNDIALSFNSPYEAAEAVKLEYASAEFQAASVDEQIAMPVVGRDKELKVNRLEICQLARERALELARMIKVKLDAERDADVDDSILVLTGGASNLPGLAHLMKKCVGINVRQGVPDVNGTVPAELKDPTYATGVGILLWALTEYIPEGVDSNKKAAKQGVTSKSAQLNGFFGSLKQRFAGLVPALFFAPKKGRI